MPGLSVSNPIGQPQFGINWPLRKRRVEKDAVEPRQIEPPVNETPEPPPVELSASTDSWRRTKPKSRILLSDGPLIGVERAVDVLEKEMRVLEQDPRIREFEIAMRLENRRPGQVELVLEGEEPYRSIIAKYLLETVDARLNPFKLQTQKIGMEILEG